LKNIFITGVTGFLGTSIKSKLCSLDYQVVTAGRTTNSYCDVEFDLEKPFDLVKKLKNIDVIIHSAAIVHVMKNKNKKMADEKYQKANYEATIELAKQAVAAGVKRFIFISSIKVNGETTTGRLPFSSSDLPLPKDAYGLSKAKAEEGLLDLAEKTGLEVVIIRPPLVYGPGVKANFASLVKLATKSMPLPFGSINNKRSFVFIDNITDFIVTTVNHPAAINQIWLISDDEDLSTSQLLRLIIEYSQSKAFLFNVPQRFFVYLCRLLGKQNIAERLCGDLQVDIKHTKEALDWTPPYTVQQAIKKTVLSFINKN
jgi:nucleoside-diphosphate-sugar epimerase